jgi:phosphate transport system ATP-binding protein
VVDVPGTAVPHVRFDDLTVSFHGRVALDRVSMAAPRNQILALIGPTKSGKSTLLKCVNRMAELSPGIEIRGRVLVDGVDVLQLPDVNGLRRRVGMVLPLPVALPLSIYDNVALAPRLAGLRGRAQLDERVEEALRRSALWDEVKDRLGGLAAHLSGGQQQRLAIARAISHRPEILCLDEFSIAIDPVTTMRIEDLLLELKPQMTILVATNLVQQARRLADRVAFLEAGRLIESGPTDMIFSEHPARQLTFDYVRGRFG